MRSTKLEQWVYTADIQTERMGTHVLSERVKYEHIVLITPPAHSLLACYLSVETFGNSWMKHITNLQNIRVVFGKLLPILDRIMLVYSCEDAMLEWYLKREH